jgi:outer membrane murein-binding lipoprotein Lpp
MKSTTVVTCSMLALALLAVAPVLSQSPASAQTTQGTEKGRGKAAVMPQACREAMAMRQSMRADQASADAKLNDLVAKMNAASGTAKVDAIATVVSEMVAQRQALHEKMAAMHAKMQAAMADCPMMRKGGGPMAPQMPPE